MANCGVGKLSKYLQILFVVHVALPAGLMGGPLVKWKNLPLKDRQCLVLFGEANNLTEEVVRRIFKPGTDMYVCLANVPDWFKDKTGFYTMIYDPDRGVVTPQTVREVMAALEAERQFIVKGTISRAPRGSNADFYDGDGNPLDVKSYSSKRTPQGLEFNPKHLLSMILEKLNRMTPNLYTHALTEMRIILDITYLTPFDLSLLEEELEKQLTVDLRSRVLRVSLTEPLRTLRPPR